MVVLPSNPVEKRLNFFTMVKECLKGPHTINQEFEKGVYSNNNWSFYPFPINSQKQFKPERMGGRTPKGLPRLSGVPRGIPG